MGRFINMDLLRNPYNWAAVLLMVLFGLFLVTLISPQTSE